MQKNLSFLNIIQGTIRCQVILVCYLLSITPFITLAQTSERLLDKRITITFNNEKLDASIVKLEAQSKIRIFYNAGQVKAVDKIYSKSFHNETLENILKALLTGTNIGYQESNAGIILKEASTATLVPQSPNGSAGQEKGSGTLKGRIVEFETSQPLPGASVYITELRRGVSSDNDGYYRLTGIPAGKYTVRISFISYATENISVNVSTDREATYDVRLQGNNALEEVTISAIRKSRAPVAHTSERQLVTEIKNLNVIASGVSSEQISKSADRDAAQVVQRISGVSVVDNRFVIIRGLNPRYNLTYLNDNVAPSTDVNSRNFGLDLIPSRIVDRILVYKSASPEYQADATGGIVKIYTKDATAVKHFDVEFQLGARQGTTFMRDFLSYNGGKLDFLGFDDGTRKLPSVLPGYGSLLLADLKPSEYASAFSPTLSYGKTTALPNMQVTANYYNAFPVFGRILSSLTSFSYKNDYQNSTVGLQEGSRYRSVETTDKTSSDNRNMNTAQLNLLQNFSFSLSERHKFFFKNFFLQQGQDNTVVRVSHPTAQNTQSPDLNKDITLSYQQRFLYAGNLGGLHQLQEDRQVLSWNVGYTYSNRQTPDQRVIRLRGMMPEFAMGDADLQWWAHGFSPSDSEDLNTVPLSLGIISRLWSRNSEGIYNGALDYTFKPTDWVTVKIGTFQQWKRRALSRRIYTVHEGNVDPSRFGPGAINPYHYVDPNLTRFREGQLPQIWTDNYLNDAYSGLYVVDRTMGSDMYVGTEQNNSAYLALTLTPYPWIEAHGGLRYEYNRQKIGAAIPTGAGRPISEPVLTDHSSGQWLPSINVSLKPTEQWTLRVAYGKTVNRTEFREVSPFRELDFENNTEISGNPNLVSARVENYDVRLEYYPNTDKGDAISFGAFYKEITNPIERVNTSSRVISLFPSISFSNATSATVKGLELELRKSLAFLPGALFRDLSIIANASLIDSWTKYENLSATSTMIGERPLQGQAPFLVNAGLYYDNAAWGTRIAGIYNYAGENIYAVGLGERYNSFIDGPEYRGSLIELPRHLLDFSATQRIGKGMQLKFTIQNLLDQKLEVAEDFNFTNKYEPLVEIADPDYKFPIRYEGDNIASSFRPGRYFNLSFSYSF